MRIPLITPLASRNGTVEKDEKLVNCYGEQDAVTKETRVIKRAGIDEGDAMLTGPDIYGHGVFSYDGYIFAVMNDVLGYWVYVGGGGPGGGGGGTYISFDTPEWDAGTTYAIGDKVFYNGKKYYNYIPGSGVTPGSDAYTWSETPPGAHTYSCNYNSYAGPVCASQDAAAFAAYNLDPAHSCATKNTITPPNYGIWSTDWYRADNLVYASQWVTFNNCGSTSNSGVVQYGTITQVT